MDFADGICFVSPWQPKLKQIANDLGMSLFSTPFDASSVDFLEAMQIPVHKIASFENVDLPLLRRIAQTGKPVIMPVDMFTLGEIDEAVQTLRSGGTEELALGHVHYGIQWRLARVRGCHLSQLTSPDSTSTIIRRVRRRSVQLQ